MRCAVQIIRLSLPITQYVLLEAQPAFPVPAAVAFVLPLSHEQYAEIVIVLSSLSIPAMKLSVIAFDIVRTKLVSA